MIDPRIEALTRAFYEWERRGRGWDVYPYLVALEPSFSIPAPPQSGTDQIDDTRKETFLSRLFRSGADEWELEPEPPDEASPERKETIQYESLRLLVPEGIDFTLASTLAWLKSISTLRHPIAFEFVGVDGRVSLELGAAREEVALVQEAVSSVLPGVVSLPAEEELIARWKDHAGAWSLALEFGLSDEFVLPFHRLRDLRVDPLAQIIGSLAESDGLAISQILFTPVSAPWNEAILYAVTTPDGKPFFADAPEVTAQAREKVSSPLVAAGLRVVATSSTEEGVWHTMRGVAGGLAQLSSPQGNELIPVSSESPERVIDDILHRTTHRHGMLLSLDELVGLVHLPGSSVQIPGLVRLTTSTKEAPESVRGAGVLLGINSHLGRDVEVRLSIEARLRHCHIVGASGTGKSTLLVSMMLDDIDQGSGVAVLDPHGDLVDELLARIPESRHDDVILFDPSDPEYVVGWNILSASTELEKDLLASDLAATFERLATSWGDQMTTVLSNAVLAFLNSSRGGTLFDLRRFLVNDRFRAEFLESVNDDYISAYWQEDFKLIANRKPQAPILTRLNTFLRNRQVRDVVTLKDHLVDFRSVLDEGRIFLGRLSQGAIGNENASLLGSLLLSKIHQVTLSRQDTQAADRRPFFLYLDEFHELATQSMATMFSGVRKYGLALTVAHQDLYQLRGTLPAVERAVLANAHTRICFCVGDEDARRFADGFSAFDAAALTDLGVGESIVRVGKRTDDFNLETFDIPQIDREGGDELRRAALKHWGVRREEAAREPQAPLPAREGRTDRKLSETKPKTPNVEPKVAFSKLDTPHLDKSELDYLEHIAVSPFTAVRDRNSALGLSASTGQRIKTKVLDDALVKEITINPGGRGQQFKLLELTTAGRGLLSEFGVAPTVGLGRGGIAHQWWVSTIAEWLSDQGLKPKIEDESEGVRVDLTYRLGNKKIAVEVETSSGHVLENISKDLEGGFDSVVTLLDESLSIEEIELRVRQEVRDQTRSVRLGLLTEFRKCLAIPTSARHLRPPNQNKEPSRPQHRRRSRVTSSPHQEGPHFVPEPGVLTTPAAAEYLGLSPATLETMRSRGGGPVFSKLGRRVVYRREDLDEWVSERRRRSTSDDGTSP